MKKKVKFEHPRLLPAERKETPLSPDVGDEVYCSGVFFFNVSAMLKWLEQNPQPTVDMSTGMWGSFSEKEDRYGS